MHYYSASAVSFPSPARGHIDGSIRHSREVASIAQKKSSMLNCNLFSGEIEVVVIIAVVTAVILSWFTPYGYAMNLWSRERSISLPSEEKSSRAGTEAPIGAWPFLSPLIYERRQRTEIELERRRRRGTFNYGTPAGCAAEIGELSETFAGRFLGIRCAITVTALL